MSVYERIESLRKERKLSQGKLEKELGFSNGSVSKWKNSTPTMERLQKIADYFGVTVDYLMTGKESDESESSILIESNAPYYIDDETAKTAQEIYDNDKILFDVYKTADKDRLVQYAKKLAELRRLEEGEE